MRVVITNGFPRAGKDTFISMCEKYARCDRCSSVDMVKVALSVLGWNGVKTPEIRLALSNLKDISTKLFDGPVQYVLRQVAEAKSKGVEFFFVHAREPAELLRYRELGALIVLVDREPEEPILNHADANVREFDYDFIIPNNGTLEELDRAARNFILTYKED